MSGGDHVAGFTSTGSKRPETLFGEVGPDLPIRMTRSSGCRVWDERGREFIDYIMGLGSVALGYGNPEVTHAVMTAVESRRTGSRHPSRSPGLCQERSR